MIYMGVCGCCVCTCSWVYVCRRCVLSKTTTAAVVASHIKILQHELETWARDLDTHTYTHPHTPAHLRIQTASKLWCVSTRTHTHMLKHNNNTRTCMLLRCSHILVAINKLNCQSRLVAGKSWRRCRRRRRRRRRHRLNSRLNINARWAALHAHIVI